MNTPLAGYTILLIDNHPYAREAMQDLLELYGADVVVAADGFSGIEMAGKVQPDLILSDYMMDDLDGLDVLKAVRENPDTASIPFVAITVSLNPAVRELFMQRGADAFLIKVDEVNHLLSTLTQVLERKSADR